MPRASASNAVNVCLQRRRVERAAAGVIALRHAPKRIGRRESQAGTRRLLPETSAQTARDGAEQAAQQLASELLDVLRREADAERGDEVLRVRACPFRSRRPCRCGTRAASATE